MAESLASPEHILGDVVKRASDATEADADHAEAASQSERSGRLSAGTSERVGRGIMSLSRRVSERGRRPLDFLCGNGGDEGGLPRARFFGQGLGQK